VSQPPAAWDRRELLIGAVPDAVSGLQSLLSRRDSREKSGTTEQIVSALTDTDLVTNIQRGQTEAEAALYEKYAARVYYVALRESRLPHDAEDVRAETFLRVLQAIRGNSLRSPEALASFVLGTTRNVLHELFQRRKLAGKTKEPEAADLSTPSHEEQFLDSEVQHAIERTIVRLKPRERDFLRMHFYEELPTQEIARRAGIAPERVRLVKSRALKHFREFYGRLDRARGPKKIDTQGR
jgi:RNA polymerase sigma factor (sigma-70 family)